MNKSEEIVTRFCEWRQTNKGMFTAISCGCLGALAVLGHLLSGSTIVVLLLVFGAIVSTKFNFKLVKIQDKGKFN